MPQKKKGFPLFVLPVLFCFCRSYFVFAGLNFFLPALFSFCGPWGPAGSPGELDIRPWGPAGSSGDPEFQVHNQRVPTNLRLRWISSGFRRVSHACPLNSQGYPQEFHRRPQSLHRHPKVLFEIPWSCKWCSVALRWTSRGIPEDLQDFHGSWKDFTRYSNDLTGFHKHFNGFHQELLTFVLSFWITLGCHSFYSVSMVFACISSMEMHAKTIETL